MIAISAATHRDRDKAGEDPVAESADVVGPDPRKTSGDDEAQEEGGDASVVHT